MSEVLGYIDGDGYTESGIIRAVPGLYPAVRLDFRPMLIEQRVEYLRVGEKQQGQALRRYIAGCIVRQVKAWDLKDMKGGVVAFTVENVLRLKSRLFDRIFAIVIGEEAPDETPDKSSAEADVDLADILKATETGRSVQEVREERQRKN